jgi:hypothetical protein
MRKIRWNEYVQKNYCDFERPPYTLQAGRALKETPDVRTGTGIPECGAGTNKVPENAIEVCCF